MPAYAIAQVTINDPEEFAKYLAGFFDASAPYGCRVLAATDDLEVVEGNWPRSRSVILEFPSLEHAHNWYQSPAYQAVAQHRFKSSKSNLIFIDGFNMP